MKYTIKLFILVFFSVSQVVLAQNVGINGSGSAPDASAMLDIVSSSKGLLIPRVALTGTTDGTTIGSPATSVLVYNTNASITNGNGVGYYYNSGTPVSPTWVKLYATNGKAWETTGNVGTTAPSSAIGTTVNNNFIGTTDAIDFVAATYNLERMRITSSGKVGINTSAPAMRLDVTDASTTADDATIRGLATGAARTYGVYGNSSSTITNASGVKGAANGAGAVNGVWGASSSTSGTGVYGLASSASGIGINGSNSATASAAQGFAGLFLSSQTGGAALASCLGGATFYSNSAVSGVAASTIASGAGVVGDCDNATGVGVVGTSAGTGNAVGVEGYSSANNVGPVGVYGVNTGVVNGTGFLTTTCRKAIYGQANNLGGTYLFGVYGSGGNNTRSGGVIGHNNGASFYSAGALGYYSAALANISVYGFGLAFTTGGTTGRMHNNNNNIAGEIFLPETNNNIGLGIYGGVMGGWIKGLVYGVNLSGKKYGAYVHGKTITNDVIVVLNKNEISENRIATYATTSTKVEVSTKGKHKLESGSVFVAFDADFRNLVSSAEPIIITCTPLGNTNGVYVSTISPEGFTVVENNKGVASVDFNWIAIGVKKGYEKTTISEEIIANDFEEKINGNSGVMYNDNNPETPEYSIWWDGNKVRFDRPTIKKDLEPANIRLNEAKEYKVKSR